GPAGTPTGSAMTCGPSSCLLSSGKKATCRAGPAVGSAPSCAPRAPGLLSNDIGQLSGLAGRPGFGGPSPKKDLVMTVTAQRLSAQGLAGLGMGSQPGSFSPAFPAPAGTPINRRVLPPRSFRRWRAVPDRAEPAGPRGVNQANPNQARP